jgi:hypothetical protein
MKIRMRYVDKLIIYREMHPSGRQSRLVLLMRYICIMSFDNAEDKSRLLLRSMGNKMRESSSPTDPEVIRQSKKSTGGNQC